MPSIMGQAMQGAGPSLSGIGSWLGSAFGGGGGMPTPPSDTMFAATPSAQVSSGDPNAGVGWNTPAVSLPNTVSPTVPDTGGGSTLSSSWNPSMPAPGLGAGMGWGASTGETPGDVMNTPTTPTGTSAFGAGGAPMAGSYASAVDAAGNPIASPANAAAPAAPGSPESVMNQTAGQQAGGGDPATQQSMVQKVLTALLGTSASGAGGKATPGILAGLAAGGGDLMKYLQQRQLQDPKALAAAAGKMNAANAKALRKQIFPQITATAQETGQINAPYLMNQAYTTAIAPILAQMREQAMNQWLEANRLTGGLYPGNSDISTLAGLVQPGIYGGSSGGSS